MATNGSPTPDERGRALGRMEEVRRLATRQRRRTATAVAVAGFVALAVALPLALVPGSKPSSLQVVTTPTTAVAPPDTAAPTAPPVTAAQAPTTVAVSQAPTTVAVSQAPTTVTPPMSATTVPQASTTVVRDYTPWANATSLKSTVKTTGTLSGSCFTGSVAVAGAYRCTSGSYLYDPCFAPPSTNSPRQVACQTAPWMGAELISLTSALPSLSGNPGQTQRPFAIQLSSGIRCVLSTGANSVIDGVTTSYGCDPEPSGFAGQLDQSGTEWTVKYSASQTDPAIRTEPVVTAWF